MLSSKQYRDVLWEDHKELEILESSHSLLLLQSFSLTTLIQCVLYCKYGHSFFDNASEKTLTILSCHFKKRNFSWLFFVLVTSPLKVWLSGPLKINAYELVSSIVTSCSSVQFYFWIVLRICKSFHVIFCVFSWNIWQLKPFQWSFQINTGS